MLSLVGAVGRTIPQHPRGGHRLVRLGFGVSAHMGFAVGLRARDFRILEAGFFLAVLLPPDSLVILVSVVHRCCSSHHACFLLRLF